MRDFGDAMILLKFKEQSHIMFQQMRFVGNLRISKLEYVEIGANKIDFFELGFHMF